VPENGSGDPVGIKSGGVKFEGNELDANGDPIGVHTKLMRHYRTELIDYLVKVAGPEPLELNPKPFPRPTGVATQLVVTEFDLPADRSGAMRRLDPRTGRVERLIVRDGRTVVEEVPPTPVNEYRTGSDWTLGTRDEHEERGTHDIAVGTDGYIYYGANAMSSDARGFVWWARGGEIVRLDLKTLAIRNYPGTPVISHGTDVDSKGYVWGSTGYGTVRVDIETGAVTEFRSVTPYSRPYDMGIDGLDNVYFSQIAVDKMGVVDGRTGAVTEIALPPMKSPDLLPEDVKVFNEIGSWDHNSAPGQLGPRRMGADRYGNFAYAGLYWAGAIAQVDGRTKTLVGIHEVPNGRWAQPYKMIPDKNRMVWFSNSAADMLGKFNPNTKTFTMYPLPTRGTNSRHLGLDETTSPTTVWVPYTGAGKVARVQFRHDTSKN
jgi:streptogramin lyase